MAGMTRNETPETQRRLSLLESGCRRCGANLLAASLLIASPFIVCALTYKAYTWFHLGSFSCLGAPTGISFLNRIVTCALITAITFGAIMLIAAKVFRVIMARRGHVIRNNRRRSESLTEYWELAMADAEAPPSRR